MKIRIALLEDEQSEKEKTLEFIDKFFKESNQEYEITSFNNSADFLKLDFSTYDLALLDIILNEQINGIDVAKKIRESKSNISIMFITKTAQFAIDGYEVEAIDYILKPVSYFEFAMKMKKAIKRISTAINDKPLTFKTNDGLITIKANDILYFEVIRHYLFVHTKNKVYKVRGTMRDISNTISDRFARSSNSFLVNLSHVSKIVKQEVILDTDVSIPLTKLFKDSFIEALTSFSNQIEL